MVLEPQGGAHQGRRVRGPGLQSTVGRVPTRGGTFDTMNSCNRLGVLL